MGQRTDQSPYPSKYSPDNWVTAAQYIIEILCEKLARTKHKDLPVCFWRLPEWANFYKSQLRVTHALLKKFSEKAIITTIKEKNIWSLRPKWVQDAIVKKQKELDLAKVKVEQSDIYANPDSQVPTVVSEFKKREFRPLRKTRLLELDND